MMLSSSEVISIATELLDKYGSKSAITKHVNELVRRYGKKDYMRILAEAKRQRDLRGEWKKPKPETELMQRRLTELKSHYKRGVRYAFVVKTKRLSPVWSVVSDSFGFTHPIDLSPRYKEGDLVSCEVWGFYSRINERNEAIVNLRLKDPRLVPSNTTLDTFEPEEPIKYIKRPEEWWHEVDGLGKHVCGKPFTCSCCGRDFPAKKGYRIDFREIYFCMDCKRKVFPPSGRGWAGRIISTPMGNKR